MTDRHLHHRAGRMASLLAAVMLSGCAAATPGYSPVPVKAPPPDTSGTFDKQASTYTLSAAERELDCRKLSGRIQVRILQLKADKPPTSEIARSTQSTVKSVIGGSNYGIDPKGQRTYDRAQIDAYNAELAKKACPAFDIDAELASTDPKRTPQPVRKP